MYYGSMTLEKYLKKNKITLTDFSKDTQISLSMISRIISRNRRPSPQKALRIENATGGKVSRLELLYP